MPAPKATATAQGQGITFIDVTVPASVGDGDLVLIRFATNANGAITQNGSGYTLAQDGTSSGLTSGILIGKVATAADANTVIRGTGPSSRWTAMVVVIAAGDFDPATWANAGNFAFTDVTINANLFTSPSVSGAAAGATVLAWCVAQGATGAGAITVTGVPAGYTQPSGGVISSTAAGGKNNAQAVSYMTLGAAGATGTADTTWSQSSTGRANMVVVPPKPVGGGGSATGTIGGSAPTPTAAATVALRNTGTVAGSVPTPTAAATATLRDTGTIAGGPPAPTGVAPAMTIAAGAITGSIPPPTASATVALRIAGALDATAPEPAVDAAGMTTTPSAPGSVDMLAPAPTVSVLGLLADEGTVAGGPPPPEATLLGSIGAAPPVGDRELRGGAARLVGDPPGVAVVESRLGEAALVVVPAGVAAAVPSVAGRADVLARVGLATLVDAQVGNAILNPESSGTATLTRI